MSMTVSQNINPAAYTASSKVTEQNQPAAQESSPSKTRPSEYDRVTKDGDTLKLSPEGREKMSPDTKIRISDASLAGYSESRIIELYSRKEITKQQYDKALKNRTR